jgi:hypothetical protein
MKQILLLFLLLINFQTAHAEAPLNGISYEEKQVVEKQEKYIEKSKKSKRFNWLKKKQKSLNKSKYYEDDLIFWSGIFSITFPIIAIFMAPSFFLPFAFFFAILAYSFAVVQRRNSRRNFKINFGFSMSIIVLSAAIFFAIISLLVIISLNN